MRQSGRIKLGGGVVNALTKDTILRGKGNFVTDLDYDNIINNRLVFCGDDFIIEKTELSLDNISYSNVYFASNLYYRRTEIDNNFQHILIPNLGININNQSNISVNFSDGGWTSNNLINSIYTLSSKIGIGISEPLATIHINNNNANLIIDNNLNKFKFEYDNNNFTLGNNNIKQLIIHKNASLNSLNIDEFSIVNISNINILNKTNLTSNIKINDKPFIEWLISDNNIATQDFVANNNILTNETILYGKGSNITNLDYKNITLNKLIFNSPLKYDPDNNTVNADLSLSGWTSNTNTSNIYSSFKSKIGIGTDKPLASLHIGSTFYNKYNYNNNGILIISKTDIDNIINKNFKLGYDDDFNFSFGNYRLLNDGTTTWTKQFYINHLAPEGCLIINGNGNININNSLNINSTLFINRNLIFDNNYNINIDNNNNFAIANNNIIINNQLNTVGIGTIPDEKFKLLVDGDIKTTSNFYVNDIYASNINLSNLNVFRNINTNLLTSTNIDNINLIKTQNIDANNIIASTNLRTPNIICSLNIICSNNITCSNNLNVVQTLNANTINSSNIIINNNIIGKSINANNLTISSNITTNSLNALSSIKTDNIDVKNISTLNINIDNNLLTNTINSDFIYNSNNIITNEIFSSNINTLNIDTSNITANNINIIDTIVSKNINTSYIINNTKITTNELEVIYNLKCNSSINAISLNVNNIYVSDNIGINILEPLSELHICKKMSSFNNTSLIITGNYNSFKIGYNDTDNFILGAYNTVSKYWKNQIFIDNNAPDNTFIINNSGNITIGNDIDNINLYKLNVIGDLNAINLYEKGVKILNNSEINQLINTSLQPYLTIDYAATIYPTKYLVTTQLNTNLNLLEDTIISLLSTNSNIYSSSKRFPYGTIYDININNTNIINTLYYYIDSNIYGIKENFKETISNYDDTNTIYNYTIYYSSSKSIILDKYYLFLYDDDNYNNTRNSVSWGNANYLPYYIQTNTTNILNLDKNSIIHQGQIRKTYRYYGDFLIIKYDIDFILTKFRFYVLNTENNYKVPNAPSLWRCYGSNDAIVWTIIKEASNDILKNSLSHLSYIDTQEGYAYYEHQVNNIKAYRYIGFVFSKIVFYNKYKISNYTYNNNSSIGLELFKFELFGKKNVKALYITSNVLEQSLTNYIKQDYIIDNYQYKIICSEPLFLNGNVLGIDIDFLYNNSTANIICSNITCLNRINVLNLVSSYLVSSNINSLNKITTSNLITSNIINDNYLSSYSIYAENNVGIGDNPYPLYKLNVNGIIYSSNDIICNGNFIENGSNLKDKYLSINDAGNFINTNVLRNELSNNQPNIQKKYGFRAICNKSIILNNETYYKHDVDLSLYIKSKVDSIDENPYRIFGIKCFSTSLIFNNNINPNKPPNILQYDIYSSYIINLNTINICAIGFPSNYYLNKITKGDIFLLKTTNYDYISILSKTSNLSVSCIISDFLF